MTALLDVRDVSIDYGGVRAVDQVSLQVEPGALVGLIGPNGAGKTSLIDAISGFTPTSTGSVIFGGVDVTAAPPHRRARRGLARTFQSLELFDDLTVRDNLLAASEMPRWWTVFADVIRPARPLASIDRVDAALARLGISALAERSPDEISQGQRKLVSVARALAGAPRLMLLDEPASGLSTAESAQLGVRLRKIVDDGCAVLLVDHDMSLVLNVCDVVHVLDFGRTLATGSPAEIRNNPEVIGAYLGEAAAR